MNPFRLLASWNPLSPWRKPLTPVIQVHGPPLPVLRLRFSSRVERHPLPSFLVINKHLGHHLESVVQDFIHEVQTALPPGPIHIGAAWGSTQEPGLNRTIRIAHSLPGGHPLASDITLRAQGDELYVRMGLITKTRIAALRSLLFGSAFAILWSLLCALFLATTDIHYSVGWSFAEKYFKKSPEAGLSVLVLGWDVDPDPEHPGFRRVPTMTLADYLLADPVLFLHSLASVPALLAAVVAGLLMLLPNSAMRYACRFLGWPTPEDFDTAALAHKAWVERLFYRTLERRYGVTRIDVLEVPVRN